MQEIEAVFTVLNKRGLHTRPSTEIVICASRFRSQMTLSFKMQEVNAKSLLGILMLAASKGSKIKVKAEGDDAKEAVATLLDLAKRQFNITY